MAQRAVKTVPDWQDYHRIKGQHRYRNEQTGQEITERTYLNSKHGRPRDAYTKERARLRRPDLYEHLLASYAEKHNMTREQAARSRGFRKDWNAITTPYNPRELGSGHNRVWRERMEALADMATDELLEDDSFVLDIVSPKQEE